MVDVLSPSITSEQICFYSDASAAAKLGYGCIYNTRWIRGDWDANFIKEFEPSIEYLELFALCAGIFTWGHLIRDVRVTVFCDNMAVISMMNKITSSCKNCMILLRLLMLNGLKFNRRLNATYVSTKNNFLADALLRNQMQRFRHLSPHMNKEQDQIHSDLWPMSKVFFM